MAKYDAKNMDEVIANNTEAGYHWFDEDTMRFWGCEVVTKLFSNNTFITVDDNFNGTRKLYSIRTYDPDTAAVGTLSFQKHDKLDDAIEYALS